MTTIGTQKTMLIKHMNNFHPQWFYNSVRVIDIKDLLFNKDMYFEHLLGARFCVKIVLKKTYNILEQIQSNNYMSMYECHEEKSGQKDSNRVGVILDNTIVELFLKYGPFFCAHTTFAMPSRHPGGAVK